jgi:hypothetical protein
MGPAMAQSGPPAWLPGWSPTLSVLVAIGLFLLLIGEHVWMILVQLHYLRQELRDRREA